MPSRSQIAITKSRVDALQPGQQLWDAHVVGFGIVANKHSKTYKLKYYFHSRQRMLTIGRHGSPYTVETARNAANAHLVQLKTGIDPASAKKVSGQSVAQLCDEYMEKHAFVNKKASSAHEDQVNIKNHIKPLIGGRLVQDISTGDIEKFKSDVQQGKTAPKDPLKVRKDQRGGKPVTGGKGVSNRCMALLSKMLNLAELWGYRGQNSNPVKGVTRYKEGTKERFLTDEELRLLWAYLNQMEKEGITVSDGSEPERDKFAMYSVAAIRLLILTGARVSEIKTLKWTMVDLKGKRLNLPDSKTGRKTIQLSDSAVEVLGALPRVKDNPYVIVGRKAGTHLVNLRKAWVHIRGKTDLNDVRIHDLRHSFASFAAAQGQPLLVIGKLLGHKNPATTQRYVHLTDKLLGDANQNVSDSIGAIVAGKLEEKSTEKEERIS